MRDPRVRGQRQEQDGNINAQHHLAQHNTQQTNQNTQLMLQNASLQPHTSQPSGINLSPLPPYPQAQRIPRTTRQMSPQVAHVPPHNSQLVVPNSNQIARAAHHSPHHSQDMRASYQQNAYNHTCGYDHNCIHYSHGSMGQNSQNLMYGTHNHMGQHSSYGGYSSQNYPYCHHPNSQNWHEPVMNSEQIITCTSVASCTMTHNRNATNGTVASHSIEDACMSLSAMANSTAAEANNSGGHHQRHTTLSVAAAMHWTPPENANVGADYWQAHTNTHTPYRPQNRLPLMDPNAFTSNNENFHNASTDRLSPRIASVMPDWLWTCRHWPGDH